MNPTVAEKAEESALEKEIKRLGFWDVFQLNEEGNLGPKRSIRIRGRTFPRGIYFLKEKNLLSKNIGYDIGAYEEDGVLELDGFYIPK